MPAPGASTRAASLWSGAISRPAQVLRKAAISRSARVSTRAAPGSPKATENGHRSLAALAKRREALNEARSAIDAGDPGLATIRENFEAGSAKLDAALNYHEREQKRAIGDVEVLRATIEHHKWAFKAWTESYANANDHRVREKLAAKCNAFGRQLNRQARHLVTEYSRYETQRERPE